MQMTHDEEYFRLVDFVFQNGRTKKNRTGIQTIGAFGAQARFNLETGFPILTTKKVYFRSIVHELLWFLSGSTNITDLLKNEVHIWDEWAYKKYVDNFGNVPGESGQPPGSTPMTQEQFTEKLLADKEFGGKWGDLGMGTYGGMWRSFPFWLPKYRGEVEGAVNREGDWEHGIDQIQRVVDSLKNNPESRRHVVSAWHPYWVDHCALPPCHVLFQFHTEELSLKERVAALILIQKDDIEKMMAIRKLEILGDNPTSLEAWNSFFDKSNTPKYRLNLQLYQRSADLFLGVPFNISSYSLLLHMMAQVVNMIPGVFVHSFGDIHIYENHIEQLKLQKERSFFKSPRLFLNKEINNLFEFQAKDIILDGYEYHPAIKGEIAI